MAALESGSCSNHEPFESSLACFNRPLSCYRATMVGHGEGLPSSSWIYHSKRDCARGNLLNSQVWYSTNMIPRVWHLDHEPFIVPFVPMIWRCQPHHIVPGTAVVPVVPGTAVTVVWSQISSSSTIQLAAVLCTVRRWVHVLITGTLYWYVLLYTGYRRTSGAYRKQYCMDKATV